MSRRFDYFIQVEQDPRPFGGRPFKAKFGYIYELTNGRDDPFTPPIPEAWGHTEQEARDKLEAHVREWERTGHEP